MWRAFSHSTSDGISGHLFSYRPSNVQGVALMPSDINMTAITPLPTPLHMYIYRLCTYVYYKHNVYIYICQAANLAGFRASEDPRFEAGIPDFMNGILYVYCPIDPFPYNL